MCGRFIQTSSAETIARAFHLTNVSPQKPKYNIAPTQAIATVVSSPEGQREFRELRWGLIPSWAKEKKIGAKLINARAETVAEKPSFRSAFRKRRCLIIANGFYEWQNQKGEKQPFCIQRKDEQIFAFAGLWEGWQAPEGKSIESCTIITTEANEIMAPIHKRMPVILNSQDYHLWLDQKVTAKEKLQPLLVPYDSEVMKVYPVSKKVNNPRNSFPF